MTMGEPYLLEVQDITVSFDGFKAVDALSFCVDKNEIRAVIGPNGAGKTTLLDLISGRTRPEQGMVKFKGEAITGLKEHEIVDAGVGRKFQTPSVYEALTVFENLEMAYPSSRSWFGAWRFARTKEVVARVLMQAPELMMLDEPVAGMSPAERERTAELLNTLCNGRSVVVVEHDMQFVKRIAHKVTVLHQGKLLAEGKMEAVQNDPRVIEVYLGH
jgi:urea transport system ATP-binding protein